MRRVATILLFSLLCASATTPVQAQPLLDAKFIYQGQIKRNGVPLSDTCDFQFTLWNSPTSRDLVDQVGPTINFSPYPTTNDPIEVVDGLFSATLDFGAESFTGEPRYLQVGVRCPSTTDLIPLAILGRQELTVTPHAAYSLKVPWDGIVDIPAGFADGVDDASSLMLPVDMSFAGSNEDAFAITQTGTGRAVHLSLDNPTSFWEVMTLTSNGTGPTLLSQKTGSTGHAGRFEITNAENPNSALFAMTGGTGAAIHGTGAADGTGVVGQVEGAGTAVYGVATATSGSNIGVHGQTLSPDGYAGYFEGGRSYFAGNVGIGTSTPTEALAVNGVVSVMNDVSELGQVRITRPTGTPGVVAIADNGNRRDIRFYDSGIALVTSSSSSAPGAVNGIRIDESGRVGIGTADTDPGYQLQVQHGGTSFGAIRAETSYVLGTGVSGIASATATETTNNVNVGVSGMAAGGSGIGVAGQATGGANSIGVSGYSEAGTGVRGRSNASGGAGVFGWAPSVFSNSTGVLGETGSANGFGVFSEGDFGGTGAKYFVHPHPHDPSKEIRFISLEGNESGTYFRGSAQLANGRAVIDVPEEFRLVSEPVGITTQLTAKGPNAGLWVESESLAQIVVRGNGDASFNYFVNGVRRGFGSYEPMHENQAFVPKVRNVPYGTQYRPEYRRILVQNGILNPDLTPNERTARERGWRLREPTPEEVSRSLSIRPRPAPR